MHGNFRNIVSKSVMLEDLALISAQTDINSLT